MVAGRHADGVRCASSAGGLRSERRGALLIGLALAALALAAAASLLLAVGDSRRQQAAVIIAGAAVLGGAMALSLALDCPGCTPEIGLWLGAFALAGWLVGWPMAVLLRRRGARLPSGPSIVAGCFVMAAVAGLVAYGRGSLEIVRWGCPSQAELDRVQSVEDVTEAFAEHGLPLEPIPQPAWLPPREPAYRGALAFRHRARGATVYVLVCRQRCAISRFRFGEARRVGEQRWRLGIGSNNNVPVWVTEDDPRSGARLLDAISDPLRRVHPSIAYGSRCYVR